MAPGEGEAEIKKALEKMSDLTNGAQVKDGLKLLENQLTNKTSRENFVHQDGLPLLLSLLRHETRGVVLGSLACIAVVAARARSRSCELVQLGVLAQMRTLFESCGEAEVDLARSLLVAVSALAKAFANKDAIAESGLISFMSRYIACGNSDLIYAATSALIFTASGHYTNKNRVASYPGCLATLVTLLASGTQEQKDRAAGVLFNLSASSNVAVQIMLSEGLPPLLKMLATENSNATGCLCNMSYTEAVRSLVWTTISKSQDDVKQLVNLTRANNFKVGFFASATLSFLLLDDHNVETLVTLGALEGIRFFCERPLPSWISFTFPEWEFKLYYALLGSRFEELKAFFTYFCAVLAVTATHSSTNITSEEEQVQFNSIPPEVVPHLRYYACLPSALVSKNAGLALDSIGDLTWKNISHLTNFLAPLDLSEEVKKVAERISGEKIEMRNLLDPYLEMEDIRSVLSERKVKGGDLLKIYGALRRARHDIAQANADLPRLIARCEDYRNLQSKELQKLEFVHSFPPFSCLLPVEGGQRLFVCLFVCFLPSDNREFKAEKGSRPVFISYSWANKQVVRKLREVLEVAGIDCWMDENVMMGGEQLFEEIDKGISSSQLFLACISDQYSSSDNCKKEVLLANDRKRTILPILIASCEMWPPRGDTAVVLAGKLYVDLSSEEKFHDSASSLIGAIKKSLNMN